MAFRRLDGVRLCDRGNSGAIGTNITKGGGKLLLEQNRNLAGRRFGAAALGLTLAVLLPALALAAPAPRRAPRPAQKSGAGAAPPASATRPKAASRTRSTAGEPVAAAAGKLNYNRDVRPILSDNCFACHGPDSKTRIVFRLDLRQDAVKRGAIVPGKPQQSSLVKRIFASEPARLMPPVSSHKKLTPVQREILRRWIAEGAEYQSHWAWIAPVRRPAPAIQDRRYPVLNPIDAFVSDRLLREKILPSPQASPAVLLRRLSLDLTGLPPTPEETEAFKADRDPAAYEKQVDRLLASPRYGERMAVPWLDMVRYADTVGYHGDQNQNAWRYRDWVISSFNENKPFDRFTLEQLAGDLLPNATAEQRIATAFNRLTMVTREGGAQPREYLAKYAADRVRTVGLAWMGVTLGCAECHDHKYDPFTSRDFYSVAAYFADIRQWGVYSDYSYTPNPDLRGFTNDHPFPPEIVVPSSYLKQRRERLMASIESGAARAVPPEALAPWQAEIRRFLQAHPDGWSTPAPAVEISGDEKPAYQILEDGSIGITGKKPNVTVKLKPGAGRLAALRLELLPAGPGGSLLLPGVEAGAIAFSASAGGEKPAPLKFRHAGANHSLPRYSSGREILGVQGGWKLDTEKLSQPHTAVYLPETPLNLGEADEIVIKLPNLIAARIRISVSPLAPADPDELSFSARELDELKKETPPAAAARAFLFSTGQPEAAWQQARLLEREVLECTRGVTPVITTEAVDPAPVRILPRGNWQDESGPVVQPSPPLFLAGSSSGPRQTRLDLAKWLVSPQNPLTARAFVNRLWRLFFGNGLAMQVEDLGAQGDYPSHPELLDWLAVEFRESGWDVKRMVRLMVTSAAYRRSSSLRPELRDRDPNNRLLASQNPRRLDAEFVRDNALAVSGLLVEEIGGPPVFPYQPDGYYAALQFPDRDYVASKDERQYRRGVYSHWQRTFLHPMLANFDAPSREDCTAMRIPSNSPQQALTLLNDPAFVEASRALAQRLLEQKGEDADRIRTVYRRALARDPRDAELQSLLAFIQRMRASYREKPEDAGRLIGAGNLRAPAEVDKVELAAWTNLCRVVLNLQETITRY